MQNPKDKSSSNHSEARLPDALLQSLRGYANGPEIKVSETTEAFILSEAKQRLNKSDVVPVKRMDRFPIQMVAGLAAAFAVFAGLTLIFWAEQQPSSQQISHAPPYVVEQRPDTSLVWKERVAPVTESYADIPLIASSDATGISLDESSLAEVDAHQTDQTLPQLTGNIYSM